MDPERLKGRLGTMRLNNPFPAKRMNRHFTTFLILLITITACAGPGETPVVPPDFDWVWSNPLPQGARLEGISGVSASDIWAVGVNGAIIHYDGTQWSVQSIGTGYRLNDVWAVGTNDIFAVGLNGTIIHYDGTDWAEQNSGVTTQLWEVWGTSSNDVFAVGQDGTILHYDGTSWTQQPSGTTMNLYSLWGSSGSDVFAGGVSVILHFDGGRYSGCL